MEPMTPEALEKFPIKRSSYIWMRKRERLALPILPPTTLEARRFFFKKVSAFTDTSSSSSGGKGKIDYVAFSQEWNRTADGETRFYVTPEILKTYAAYWEKICNIRASQELMNQALASTASSARIFAAEDQPFPSFLVAAPSEPKPTSGLLEFNDFDMERSESPLPEIQEPPQDLDERAASPMITDEPTQFESFPHTMPNSRSHDQLTVPNSDKPAAKRRREVPPDKRIRKTVRKCRRCHREECPGGSDIRRCPFPCKVPCKQCGRFSDCTGVNNGKKCSWKNRD